MKLVYVLAPGHSGSTLVDCILGTHPDFCSSGELRYLTWQLARTEGVRTTVENQDLCSCGEDFRRCQYWSKVFDVVEERTGIDVARMPKRFDTAYFGEFAYQERDGVVRRKRDRLTGTIVRRWLGLGLPLRSVLWLENRIQTWIENSWILYEAMSEASGRSVVVDSSKHLTIALLLQQSRPIDVTFLFLHRDLNGLASSIKRWSWKHGKKFTLEDVIRTHRKFEGRVRRYKRRLKSLSYLDVDYAGVVARPADFIDQMVRIVTTQQDYSRQSNGDFYIDPGLLHLVAGNPMRYRGRQPVRYDGRWKSDLTSAELAVLEAAVSRPTQL